MNLQMPRDVIERLAARGADAGRNILYGDAETDTTPFNFDVHRWIRYRNAMSSLDELLTGMYQIWPEQQDFLTAYVPPPGLQKYQPINPEKDRAATRKVMELANGLNVLDHPAAGAAVPQPEPEARLVPPL
jgi:hypothetical protein